ncbi:nucleoside deaminase [Dietzia sp.]|uniref:nucleoside deaminase n=1 Tax=Dietzia sp. TaxID=1871616 RepID=UPI002FDAC03A
MSSSFLPEPDFARRDAERMRRCLALAAETPDGDVPVAAVVFGPEGREIAAATNRREADGDPLAHAEVLALRAATEALGDGWRLTECTLVVSLEPCTMCAGAAIAARVGAIVFGAWEPRTGACGSLFDVVRDRRLLWRPAVRGGVLADKAGELMTAFFEDKR